MKTHLMTRWNRPVATLGLGMLMALGSPLARADTSSVHHSDVQAAVSEAIAVHGLATAARLCGFMSEGDLNQVRMRMDRVHAARLAANDRETYLIMRGSDAFRNYVYFKALDKVQGGCSEEVRNAFGDVNASLVHAEISVRDVRAEAAVSMALADHH